MNRFLLDNFSRRRETKTLFLIKQALSFVIRIIFNRNLMEISIYSKINIRNSLQFITQSTPHLIIKSSKRLLANIPKFYIGTYFIYMRDRIIMFQCQSIIAGIFIIYIFYSKKFHSNVSVTKMFPDTINIDTHIFQKITL